MAGIFFIFTVTLLIDFLGPSVVLGQIVAPGDCPKIPAQPQFNPAQFISVRWFETLRYPSAFEQNTKCSVIDIKPSKLGALKMSFKGVSTLDGTATAVAGSAYFAYGALGSFLLTVPNSNWNTTSDIHLSIIATDYKNYALAWSCDPLCNGYRQEQVWVLSRQQTLNPEIWKTVESKYFTNGPFIANYLTHVEQTDCPSTAVLKNVNSEDDLLFLNIN